MMIRNRLAELMAEYFVRTGKRLSQDQLSEATGIAQSTISLYVTNSVKRYDMSVVMRLINFFGVSIGDFFVEIAVDDDPAPGQLVPELAGVS